MKPSDSLQSHLYDIWYSWWFHYISYDFLWNPMSKSPLSFTLENFHRHQKNIDLNPPKGRSQLLLHRVTTSPPHRGASQTCIRPATRAVPQIKTEETKLHLGYVYIYRDIWAVYIYRYIMKKQGVWSLTYLEVTESWHHSMVESYRAKKVTNELPEKNPEKLHCFHILFIYHLPYFPILLMPYTWISNFHECFSGKKSLKIPAARAKAW